MSILFVLAFVWGVLEATVFFIVPDVMVTFAGLRGYKVGLYAALFALFGALLGGSVMYFLGVYRFDWVTELVVSVPAIRPEMLVDVRASLEVDGLLAMVLGPTKGIPYKIYAVYASHVEIGFLAFFLASIPARFVRFFATAMLAAFMSKTVFTRLAFRWKVLVWLFAWCCVYLVYFSRHPF